MYAANKKERQGFTLIEMIVVMAIIGILSAVVLSSNGDARKRARDKERITEIGQITLALEMYYNACRQYPATLTTGASNGCTGVTLGSFISTIPTDPSGGAYTYVTNNSTYVVRASLQLNDPALLDDVDTADIPPALAVAGGCNDSAPNYYYCKKG